MGHDLYTNKKARRFLYKEAMHRRAEVVPYSPFEIYIDPCNACDLRCTFCPQSSWGERARGVMEWEFYERVLAEVVELRPRMVNLFCYGESLLHKRIFDMIAKAVGAGLGVRIHTNAKSLDEEKAAQLLESRLTELHFSFDTAVREDYNRMRVRSDFDLVIGNIRRFLQMKEDGGYTSPRVYMQELVPYDPDVPLANSDDYRDLVKGFDVQFTARHMHNFAGGSKEEEFAHRRDEGHSQCNQLYSRIVVTFDGKVHACCLDAEGYNIVGDLSAGDTLAQAWNSRRMQRLRRLTNEGKVEGVKPCDDCDFLRRSPDKTPHLHERLIAKALWKVPSSGD